MDWFFDNIFVFFRFVDQCWIISWWHSSKWYTWWHLKYCSSDKLVGSTKSERTWCWSHRNNRPSRKSSGLNITEPEELLNYQLIAFQLLQGNGLKIGHQFISIAIKNLGFGWLDFKDLYSNTFNSIAYHITAQPKLISHTFFANNHRIWKLGDSKEKSKIFEKNEKNKVFRNAKISIAEKMAWTDSRSSPKQTEYKYEIVDRPEPMKHNGTGEYTKENVC